MSFWRSIKLILTLKCEESTQLMSASLDQRLTFAQRTALFLHASICRSCRLAYRQLKFLRSACGRYPNEVPVRESTDEEKNLSLSADARQRMEQMLQEASGQDEG